MGSYILNIVSLSLIFRFFCDLLFSVPRIFLSNLFFLSLLCARCFSLLSIFSLLCSLFPSFCYFLAVFSLVRSHWHCLLLFLRILHYFVLSLWFQIFVPSLCLLCI